MNENTVMNIKLAIAGACSVLTALWGWFGWLVVAWVALMLSDWLVGSTAAAKLQALIVDAKQTIRAQYPDEEG